MQLCSIRDLCKNTACLLSTGIKNKQAHFRDIFSSSIPPRPSQHDNLSGNLFPQEPIKAKHETYCNRPYVWS